MHDPNGPQRWSTPVGLVTTGWVLTAAAVAWWFAAESATDRLFVGVLVLALAAVSAHATLCRPRLSADRDRSEERRVGQEWRSRWSPYH